MEQKHAGNGRSTIPIVGLTLVIGAALGTVAFAVTQSAVWIALGAGLGVVVGASLQANRN